MTPNTRELNASSFDQGMNNRAPDFRLRTQQGYQLRDAVNVDVTTSGTLRSRAGYQQAIAGADAHSLWSDDTNALYVDAGILYWLTAGPAGLVRTQVTTGVGRAVSYFSAPEGGVYWTDGVRLERAVAGASVRLNPATPVLQPSIVASTGGALVAGTYTVCFTAVDAAGRESAHTHPVQVAVPANGKITLALGTTPALPIKVYVSDVDGGVVHAAVRIVSAGTVAVDQPPLGGECPTWGMAAMPAGSIVRHFNGRLMTVVDSMLYVSEPFAPGLYRPESGFIPFQAPITIMEPVQGQSPGTYVVADQTYWLPGDITQASIVNVLPYGAVAGSSQNRVDREVVHWMSVRGLIQASTGGEVKNLQEDKIAITPTAFGATFVRDDNGTRQAVTSMYGKSTAQVAVATTYMDAEVTYGASS